MNKKRNNKLIDMLVVVQGRVSVKGGGVTTASVVNFSEKCIEYTFMSDN